MLESQNHSVEIDLFDKQIYFICLKGQKPKTCRIYTDISKCNRSAKVKSKELLKVVDGSDIDLVAKRNIGLLF
jgi:hypothetical protein